VDVKRLFEDEALVGGFDFFAVVACYGVVVAS
jgi:hypothetical protein